MSWRTNFNAHTPLRLETTFPDYGDAMRSKNNLYTNLIDRHGALGLNIETVVDKTNV